MSTLVGLQKGQTADQQMVCSGSLSHIDGTRGVGERLLKDNGTGLLPFLIETWLPSVTISNISCQVNTPPYWVNCKENMALAGGNSQENSFIEEK